MGIDPPFLYSQPGSFKFEPQSTERGFNPRAATDAAWVQAQREREKRLSEQSRQGPLIDKNQLNQHPDSYMVISSSYLDFKPLSKRNKAAIVWTRWIQLGLRIISFVGSIGLLVCLIFIKPVGENSDWLLRIPPGIAILHSAYSIWHLAKKPGARTPGSTASYFIFACIFDAGLIPFMVYTTLCARSEWLMAENNVDGHWTTLFGNDYGWPQNTLQATWLASASLGCIWVATFIMCYYLATQFRKISNLPPDMSPFEENLTSRHNGNHKKTKSTSTQMTETESNRDSAISLLNEKGPQVPWMHTRNGSTASLGTASPPRSPRHGRYESTDSLTPPRSPYKASQRGQDSPHNSTASLNTTHRRNGHARTDSNGEILLPSSPNRHSNPASPYRNSQYSSPNRSSALVPGHVRSDSPAAPSIYHSARASRSTLALEEDHDRTKTSQPVHSSEHPWPLANSSKGSWLSSAPLTSDHPDSIDRSLVPRPLDSTPPEFRHLRDSNVRANAAPPSGDRAYALRAAGKHDYHNRSPKPLGMNPPTPPVDPEIAARAAETALNTQANANNNGTYRSNRASRAGRVRQALSASADSGNKGYTQLELNVDSSDGDWMDDLKAQFMGQEETKGLERKPVLQSKWSTPERSAARVISSGYDEKGLRQGKVRERQVSGKVVEEGRSGMQGLRAEMGWA